MSTPFGVQGVSPLTALANTLLKEQQQAKLDEPTLNGPDAARDPHQKSLERLIHTTQRANSLGMPESSTQQNSIYKTDEKPHKEDMAAAGKGAK